MPGEPFDLELPTHTPLRRAAATAARPLLHWVLRRKTWLELHHRASVQTGSPDARRGDAAAYAAMALGVLDISTDCGTGCADAIPERGPLIVAANHPQGALDGLALFDVIGRVRPDVRLLANHLLAQVPGLRDLCFFVDPFERRGSTERSLSGLRAAHLWLRRGGALVIFPAGEVAHERRADGSVADSRWRATVGRLALATGASVLPVHISGANSRLFYAAGRVHPYLRTMLLARELLKRRGGTAALRVGAALGTTELTAGGDAPDAVTQRIRDAVDHLRSAQALPVRQAQPIAAAIDPAALAEDVRSLPPESKLLAAGAFEVYSASAGQLPRVLAEIGRLRERAFRAAGEGTGLSSDLDAFDRGYEHLFVWNAAAREVVGAYRIARVDRIVAAAGVEGLYTRSLFRYDAALVGRLPPALELGRSFVRQEYQRDVHALPLLWKGICAFVQQHPQYRVLFGAVSISARYSDRTRDMLVRFLEQNHLHRSLAELVTSQHPHTARREAADATAPTSVEEADALASRWEEDGRGMPVLLRQYLKLNARALGFSVDPSFGDALDALMMIDLLDVDVRILRRYFGPAGARTFLDYHHASASHAA